MEVYHVRLKGKGSNVVKLVKIFKTVNTIEIQSVFKGQLRYMVMYSVRNVAKGLSKHHCYCSMLNCVRRGKAVSKKKKNIIVQCY